MNTQPEIETPEHKSFLKRMAKAYTDIALGGRDKKPEQMGWPEKAGHMTLGMASRALQAPFKAVSSASDNARKDIADHKVSSTLAVVTGGAALIFGGPITAAAVGAAVYYGGKKAGELKDHLVKPKSDYLSRGQKEKSEKMPSGKLFKYAAIATAVGATIATGGILTAVAIGAPAIIPATLIGGTALAAAGATTAVASIARGSMNGATDLVKKILPENGLDKPAGKAERYLEEANLSEPAKIAARVAGGVAGAVTATAIVGSTGIGLGPVALAVTGGAAVGAVTASEIVLPVVKRIGGNVLAKGIENLKADRELQRTGNMPEQLAIPERPTSLQHGEATERMKEAKNQEPQPGSHASHIRVRRGNNHAR